MPSSAPATVPSDLWVTVWLEPRAAAATRLAAETVRTKAFWKNILVALQYTAELLLDGKEAMQFRDQQRSLLDNLLRSYTEYFASVSLGDTVSSQAFDS